LGLVADLLTVPHEYAPLIDLALGEISQRFVVGDVESLDVVVKSLGDLPGRVGFIPLASGGRQPPDSSPDYDILGVNVDSSRVQNRGANASRSPVHFVSSS